jgi:hypothetical protein
MSYENVEQKYIPVCTINQLDKLHEIVDILLVKEQEEQNLPPHLPAYLFNKRDYEIQWKELCYKNDQYNDSSHAVQYVKNMEPGKGFMKDMCDVFLDGYMNILLRSHAQLKEWQKDNAFLYFCPTLSYGRIEQYINRNSILLARLINREININLKR